MKLISLVTLGLVLFSLGCSTLRIETDYVHGVDFRSYKTSTIKTGSPRSSHWNHRAHDDWHQVEHDRLARHCQGSMFNADGSWRMEIDGRKGIPEITRGLSTKKII